jgi:hypothetical protein
VTPACLDFGWLEVFLGLQLNVGFFTCEFDTQLENRSKQGMSSSDNSTPSKLESFNAAVASLTRLSAARGSVGRNGDTKASIAGWKTLFCSCVGASNKLSANKRLSSAARLEFPS